MGGGHLSTKISVNCGVRQGCPLSPLLFHIALEQFTIAVSTNKMREGIKVKNNSGIKIVLYVDNIICYLRNPVCYLQNPEISLMALADLIRDFGPVVGYK